MTRCGECFGCKWGGVCVKERIYTGGRELEDLHSGKGTTWRRWPPTGELYPDCACHEPLAVKAARLEQSRRAVAEQQLADFMHRPYHPIPPEPDPIAPPVTNCVVCGNPLPPGSKATRTTCSTRCRVAAFRARQRAAT